MRGTVDEGAVMTEVEKKRIREQARFRGIFSAETQRENQFEPSVPLASYIRCDESREFVEQALEAGCDGTQTEKFEEELAEYMGFRHAVSVSSGEAALTLALRLAAEKLYGSSAGIMTPSGLGGRGALYGKRVFCPDLATVDMVNPVTFEGGEPVFIDSAAENWSMDPEVLELAFEKYPDVGIVVMNHAYGFPGDIMGIRKICFEHDALLIECAGEAVGAAYWAGEDAPDAGKGAWAKAGSMGDYAVLGFGPDRMLGPSGGALLARDFYEKQKAAYLASGAGAAVPWDQHEELGHSCRMGELEAAMLRGQLPHLDETMEKKKKIYGKYREKLDGAMACVIPVGEGTEPNYWITAMTSESNIQFVEARDDRRYVYKDVHGTAAPMEIYDVLSAFNAGSRPVCKPMSLQPVYRNHEHFTLDGAWRTYEGFYNDAFMLRCDRAREYYECGICLPSDAGMTEEEQDRIIGLIHACYDRADLNRAEWA